MRVVKYQRVSTNHQDLENQTKSIDDQIDRLGWTVISEYHEVESGMKSRDSRPQLRKLLRDSRLRMFDRVIVYSLDRLGKIRIGSLSATWAPNSGLSISDRLSHGSFKGTG